jgi:hypothetical protein
MDRTLDAARQFGDRLRFSGDSGQSDNSESHRESIDRAPALLYHSGIEISAALTPILWDRLALVCDRLKLPAGAVSAFIHCSHELQAMCLASGSDHCILQFSSALVDLLDEDEFEFVAGHELGHFLLDHIDSGVDRTSTEYFIRRRSQEISADRIGLHACKSLDNAIRALMKTVSGLTSRHLRFDVGAFISQLKKIGTSDQSDSTHPSMMIRSKALLWYSLTDFYFRGEQFYSVEQIRKIDARIERDLTRFVDGAVKQMVQATREDLLLWMVTYEVLQSGLFSLKAQTEMEKLFNTDTVQRLRSFLSDLSRDDVESVVHERVRAAREKLGARA